MAKCRNWKSLLLPIISSFETSNILNELIRMIIFAYRASRSRTKFKNHNIGYLDSLCLLANDIDDYKGKRKWGRHRHFIKINRNILQRKIQEYYPGYKSCLGTGSGAIQTPDLILSFARSRTKLIPCLDHPRSSLPPANHPGIAFGANLSPIAGQNCGQIAKLGFKNTAQIPPMNERNSCSI